MHQDRPPDCNHHEGKRRSYRISTVDNYVRTAMTADVNKACTTTATNDVRPKATQGEEGAKSFRTRGINTDITRVAFVTHNLTAVGHQVGDRHNDSGGAKKENTRMAPKGARPDRNREPSFSPSGRCRHRKAGEIPPPLARKVVDLTRDEGRSLNRREIRRLAVNLAGSVENMLQSVQSIMGDLHDLVTQIDAVTDKIEEQCERGHAPAATRHRFLSEKTVRETELKNRASVSRMTSFRERSSTVTPLYPAHHAAHPRAPGTEKCSKGISSSRRRCPYDEERYPKTDRKNWTSVKSAVESPYSDDYECTALSEWPGKAAVASVISARTSDTSQGCGLPSLRSENTDLHNACTGQRFPEPIRRRQTLTGEGHSSLRVQTDKVSKRHTHPCAESSRLSYFKFSDSDESITHILCASTPKGAMEFRFGDDLSPQQDDSLFEKESPCSGILHQVTGLSHLCEDDKLDSDKEAELPDVILQNWQKKIEQRTGSLGSLTPQMDWSYLGLTEHNARTIDESTDEVGGASGIYSYHNGYGVQTGFHQRLLAALPEWKLQQHHLPYWPSSEVSSIKSSDSEEEKELASSPRLPKRSCLPRKFPGTVSPLVSRKKCAVLRRTNKQTTVTFSEPAETAREHPHTCSPDSYCGLYETELEDRLERWSGDELDASDFSDVEVDVGSDVMDRSVTSCETGDMGYNRSINTWKTYTMTHLDSDDVVSDCPSDILNENITESSRANPGFDDVKHHYDDITFPSLVY